MPLLIVKEPSGLERAFPFQSAVRIGRHPQCDLVVADPLVSRRHARIVPEGEGWVIEDLGSVNGVFLNDRRVKRHRLQDGAVMRIGRTQIVFRAQTAEERLLASVRLEKDDTLPTLQESLEAERAALFAPEAEIVDLGALRLDYEKLRLGFRMLERLGGERRLEDALARAAEDLRHMFHADHCTILLAESDGRLAPKALAVREGAAGQVRVSQTVIQEVVRTRKAVLLSDPLHDRRFSESASIVLGGLRSILCAPILAEGKAIGVVHMDSRRGMSAFTKRDVELLAGIARYLALLVQKHRLLARVEREARLKAQFERLLSPSVAEQVLAGRLRLDRAGETKDVTILFADIRGFTRIASDMPATDVVAMLNRYFEIVVDVVFRHRGTLDKYIGDEIMTIFGAPVPLPEAADHAVACAVEIQQALTHFNREQAEFGKPPLEVGIGISSGEVVVGAIGSERTKQYTCIGEAVNMAARLTEIAKGGQILISEETYCRLSHRQECRVLPPMQIRGLEGPIRVFAVETGHETATGESRLSPPTPDEDQ